MRMSFRCKNCGRMFYMHSRLTQKIVDFMYARQNMWKVLWNKEFIESREESIVGIVEKNAECCPCTVLEMELFDGVD